MKEPSNFKPTPNSNFKPILNPNHSSKTLNDQIQNIKYLNRSKPTNYPINNVSVETQF